jgi:hypothetical protein
VLGQLAHRPKPVAPAGALDLVRDPTQLIKSIRLDIFTDRFDFPGQLSNVVLDQFGHVGIVNEITPQGWLVLMRLVHEMPPGGFLCLDSLDKHRRNPAASSDRSSDSPKPIALATKSPQWGGFELLDPGTATIRFVP